MFGGHGTVGMQQGVDIDPNAFKIADADKYRGQAQDQYGAAVERGQYAQPRQRALINTLTQQAAGQGPSLANEQLKSAQNRNLAQQLAAAQAVRSPNAALTQRNLLRNQQTAGAQLAEQGGIARMQEQQSAQQQLAQQLQNQQATADSLTQSYLAQGFGMAQAQQQALADLEKLRVQQATSMAQINSGIDMSNAASRAQQAQGMFNTAKSIGAAAVTGGASTAAEGGGMSGGSSYGGSNYLGGQSFASQLGNSPFNNQYAAPSASQPSGFSGFLSRLSSSGK